MNIPNTYQNYKLVVKATMPGSLSSFIYAYCKTENMPESKEPAYIRKAVSFTELSRYVRTHIANDFDLWYRKNEASEALNEVCAAIINAKDGRTEVYSSRTNKLVSTPFTFPGSTLQFVLVSKN